MAGAQAMNQFLKVSRQSDFWQSAPMDRSPNYQKARAALQQFNELSNLMGKAALTMPAIQEKIAGELVKMEYNEQQTAQMVTMLLKSDAQGKPDLPQAPAVVGLALLPYLLEAGLCRGDMWGQNGMVCGYGNTNQNQQIAGTVGDVSQADNLPIEMPLVGTKLYNILQLTQLNLTTQTTLSARKCDTKLASLTPEKLLVKILDMVVPPAQAADNPAGATLQGCFDTDDDYHRGQMMVIRFDLDEFLLYITKITLFYKQVYATATAEQKAQPLLIWQLTMRLMGIAIKKTDPEFAAWLTFATDAITAYCNYNTGRMELNNKGNPEFKKDDEAYDCGYDSDAKDPYHQLNTLDLAVAAFAFIMGREMKVEVYGEYYQLVPIKYNPGTGDLPSGTPDVAGDETDNAFVVFPYGLSCNLKDCTKLKACTARAQLAETKIKQAKLDGRDPTQEEKNEAENHTPLKCIARHGEHISATLRGQEEGTENKSFITHEVAACSAQPVPYDSRVPYQAIAQDQANHPDIDLNWQVLHQVQGDGSVNQYNTNHLFPLPDRFLGGPTVFPYVGTGNYQFDHPLWTWNLNKVRTANPNQMQDNQGRNRYEYNLIFAGLRSYQTPLDGLGSTALMCERYRTAVRGQNKTYAPKENAKINEYHTMGYSPSSPFSGQPPSPVVGDVFWGYHGEPQYKSGIIKCNDNFFMNFDLEKNCPDQNNAHFGVDYHRSGTGIGDNDKRYPMPEVNILFGKFLTHPPVQCASKGLPQINILSDVLGSNYSGTAARVVEGNNGTNTMQFEIKRTGLTEQASKLSYSTYPVTAQAGSDFQSTSGVIEFAPNETTKTISVPIYTDREVEADELLQLSLFTNDLKDKILTKSVYGDISNDDFPTPPSPPAVITAQMVTVKEPNPGSKQYLMFEVKRSGAVNQNSYVPFKLKGLTATYGADYKDALEYNASQGTLMFGPNQTTKTLIWEVIGDYLYENAETVELSFGTPSAGTVVSTPEVIGVIQDDDDNPVITAKGSVVQETLAQTQRMMFTIERTGNPNPTVTVNYATVGGTATAGRDYGYVSGTVTFGPNEMSRNIFVDIYDDKDIEATETVQLTLTPTNNVGVTMLITQANGTIQDDDILPLVNNAAGSTQSKCDPSQSDTLCAPVADADGSFKVQWGYTTIPPRWDHEKGVYHYEVRMSTKADFSDQREIYRGGAREANIRLPAGEYYFHVIAYIHYCEHKTFKHKDRGAYGAWYRYGANKTVVSGVPVNAGL